MLVSVKNNQQELLNEIKDNFNYFKTKKLSVLTKEKGNVIEKEYQLLPINNNTIIDPHNYDWLNLLKVAIKVTRHNKTLQSTETQYYVSNKTISVKKAEYLIRTHWHIENVCHKMLDISLNEDDSYKTKNPLKNNLIRSIVFNILTKNHNINFNTEIFKNSLNINNIFKYKEFLI